MRGKTIFIAYALIALMCAAVVAFSNDSEGFAYKFALALGLLVLDVAAMHALTWAMIGDYKEYQGNRQNKDKENENLLGGAFDSYMTIKVYIGIGLLYITLLALMIFIIDLLRLTVLSLFSV